MDVTVFYAWQDDRPGKCNRYLIRDAAKEACATITDDPSNDWHVSLDEAAQGVPGMCDIPNTILEKIRDCDVFLGDVTFVGKGDARGDSDAEVRLISNPNVLFELGYAAKAIGFGRILGVMNEAYGKPEQQMFDVKRRWAIRYDLPESSSKPGLRTARENLSRDIEAALRTILENAVLPNKGDKASERFARIRAEFESSMHDGSFHGLDRGAGVIAVTLVPDAVVAIEHAKLQTVRLLPPLGCADRTEPRGRSVVSIREGEIREGVQKRRVRCSVAEITVEGVVAAADTYWLDPAMHRRPEEVGRIIPSRAFEQVIVDSVLGYAADLRQLGVPFPWRAGVSLLRIGGYRMYAGPADVGREIEDGRDIVADAVVIRAPEELSDGRVVARLLKDAFDYIWRECGFPRSLNYDADGNWEGPF